MTANSHTAVTAAILDVIGKNPASYSSSVTTRKAAKGIQADYLELIYIPQNTKSSCDAAITVFVKNKEAVKVSAYIGCTNLNYTDISVEGCEKFTRVVLATVKDTERYEIHHATPTTKQVVEAIVMFPGFNNAKPQSRVTCKIKHLNTGHSSVVETISCPAHLPLDECDVVFKVNSNVKTGKLVKLTANFPASGETRTFDTAQLAHGVNVTQKFATAALYSVYPEHLEGDIDEDVEAGDEYDEEDEEDEGEVRVSPQPVPEAKPAQVAKVDDEDIDVDATLQTIRNATDKVVHNLQSGYDPSKHADVVGALVGVETSVQELRAHITQLFIDEQINIVTRLLKELMPKSDKVVNQGTCWEVTGSTPFTVTLVLLVEIEGEQELSLTVRTGKSFSKFTCVVTPKETFSEIKRLLTHLLTK